MNNSKKAKTELKQKETQGNKKIKQMIGDLKRNFYFMSRIHDLKEYSQEEAENRFENEEFNKKMDRYLQHAEDLKKLAKLARDGESKYEKLAKELIEKYAIDPELFIYLMIGLLDREDHDPTDYFDMCKIVDFWDERLNPAFDIPPIELDHQKQLECNVYPIHLEIHKFASKRDVLDFVEKRWDFIEEGLETYRGEKKIRIRERKYDQKMVDLIWENRDLTNAEIKVKLDEKFPDNTLVYYEIRKIISNENKRRSGEISVGQ